MNKAQWKAVRDISEVYGCSTHDILKELKANGAVSRDIKLENLDKCVTGDSYDDMFKFLEGNI